ncbi:hypothetical protein ACOTCG_14975 [Achromobacter xylosoxidans]
MHSESSGNINYWPGFVDAFSNLVLALVFVIVILAMSLGMFSGLMAKMAIQRALIEQRLQESQAAGGGGGDVRGSSHDPGGDGRAQRESAGPAPASGAPADSARTGEASVGEASADEASADEASAGEPSAGEASAGEASAGEASAGEALAGQASPALSSARSVEPAPRDKVSPAEGMNQALLKENTALRQALAALRRQKEAQPVPSAVASGSRIDAPAAPPSQAPAANERFGPMMPGGDPAFQQHIEADLARVLKEFGARQDRDAVIHVAIHVPNYALTENKRTALFYLISIKDYLMKKNVSPEQIRMHMDRAPAGQKDMTVSMSVEH